MEEKPIKVAQVIGRTINGGVENLIMNYYSYIDKSKVQFDFFVEEESKIICKENIEKYGGKIYKIPDYKNQFKYQKTLKNYFQKNQYDIVQANLNTLSVFALRAAKKAGIKIRICNSLSTTNKKEKIRNCIKNILKLFSKKYANVYFACSDLAGKWLFGEKILKNKLYYKIPNAINETSYFYNKSYKEELEEKYSLHDKTVYGTIGRLENQKNHLFLLEIFNYIYKVNHQSALIIIGDGKLEEKLKFRIRELNLENNVLILTSNIVGVRDSALKYYSLFDVFILPSLYEGLPTVGIEAQINGLPCFFSSSITMETKITDLTSFIPLSKSPKEWAEKIIKTNLKRKDVQIVIDEYDLKIQASRLLKIYQELVGIV